MRATGDRVELRPIAGTRPRGETPAEDHAFEDELVRDEKERAEHVMLVDLGRNDLGRVARFGSVSVDEFMTVATHDELGARLKERWGDILSSVHLDLPPEIRENEASARAMIEALH